jgi:hypothetical protein
VQVFTTSGKKLVATKKNTTEMVAPSYTALSMIHGHDNYRPSSTAIGGPAPDSTAAKRSGLYHTHTNLFLRHFRKYVPKCGGGGHRPTTGGWGKNNKGKTKGVMFWVFGF